jgi:hypothetical protein
MDLCKENWSAFIALGSLGFGWLLGEITQLFRSRGDYRKIRKRVLYYLMEINFILSRLDTTDQVNEYLKYVKSRFSEDALFDQKKPVIQIQIENLLFEGLIDNVLDELDYIEGTYEEALIELSKIRPIRAYYLRGVSNILNQLEEYQDFVNDITSEISTEVPELNPFMSDLIFSVKQKQFKESIENIKKEIKRMSFSIGIITFIQSFKVVKKKPLFLDDNIKESLDSMIDNLKR